jgi:hypothetical protein
LEHFLRGCTTLYILRIEFFFVLLPCLVFVAGVCLSSCSWSYHESRYTCRRTCNFPTPSCFCTFLPLISLSKPDHVSTPLNVLHRLGMALNWRNNRTTFSYQHLLILPAVLCFLSAMPCFLPSVRLSCFLLPWSCREKNSSLRFCRLQSPSCICIALLELFLGDLRRAKTCTYRQTCRV